MNFTWNAKVSRWLNFITFISVILVMLICSLVTSHGNPVIMKLKQQVISKDPDIILIALIYILQFGFIIYQLFPSTYDLKYINNGISKLFPIQKIFLISMVISHNYGEHVKYLEISIKMIVVLIMSIMYLRTQFYLNQERLNPGLDFIFGRAWLSIYLCWLFTTTCIHYFNILSEIRSLSDEKAAIIWGALGGLTLAVLLLYRDSLFGFTLVWSSIWLAVSRLRNSQQSYLEDELFISALVVAAVIGILSFILMVANLNRYRHRDQFKSIYGP